MTTKVRTEQIYRLHPPAMCALNPSQLRRRLHNVAVLDDEDSIIDEVANDDPLLDGLDGSELKLAIQELTDQRTYTVVEVTERITFKVGEEFYHADPIPKGLGIIDLTPVEEEVLEDDTEESDEGPDDDSEESDNEEGNLQSLEELSVMSFKRLKKYAKQWDMTDRSFDGLLGELIEAGKVAD